MERESNAFISYLKRAGISIVRMTPSDEDDYRKKWFEKVVPADKQQRAIDSYCFDKDGYSGYLWHVFSYYILECIEGDNAKKIFDELRKQDAILLVNLGNDCVPSCKMKNISGITAKEIDALSDVIFTDTNFEWTYVKTHETGLCGPYFHWIEN